MKKEQHQPGTTLSELNKSTTNQAQKQKLNPEFDDFNIEEPVFEVNEDLKKLATEAEIDLSIPVPKPPLVLSLYDETLFYLGDISMITGKAKSRKTFLNSMLLHILVGNLKTGIIKADLPEDKNVILSFDTEQGKYHAYKAAKRVHYLLQVRETPNFKAYGLRKHDPETRLKIIEHIIYNTPNLGVVFIDGIRDLIRDINSPEEATMISSKLMKWTEELNIHICCLLHMNKGDNNARGHVGTEMINKSLTIISVAKDEYNKECSKVEILESRDKEPKPFTFGINEHGLPYILNELQIGELVKPIDKTKRTMNPKDLAQNIHTDNLNLIFGNEKQFTYGNLLTELQNAYDVGVNNAKKIAAHLCNVNLLLKHKKGNKSLYSLV